MSEQLLTELKDFKSNLDERIGAFSGGLDKLTRRLDGIEAEWTRKDFGGNREQPKGFFDEVLASDEFKRFAAGGFKGRMSIKLGNKSLIDEHERLEYKTTITSDALGSATPGILTPDRLQGVFGPGVRKARVRDAFARISTRQNAMDWIKENVFTNASSPTAETISKPESALTFTVDSVPSRTIAHWIPVSKQAFDDAPEVMRYMSNRLLHGLANTLDYEIVAGSGSGQHISGMSIEATSYDTARNASGDTYIDKLNHAVSQLEDSEFMATTVFLHPRDWRAIQLTKEEPNGANTGHYLLGGPTQDGIRTIWDCQIIKTTAVTRGTFYVADSSYGVVIDRQDPIIEISDSHSDFFLKNLLAVRAEQRVSWACTTGAAFIYGAF